MLLEKDLNFGKILVDVKRLRVFVERGTGGKELFDVCNQAEKEQLFHWLIKEPGISQDDVTQLAWEYGLCDCNQERMERSRITGIS